MAADLQRAGGPRPRRRGLRDDVERQEGVAEFDHPTATMMRSAITRPVSTRAWPGWPFRHLAANMVPAALKRGSDARHTPLATPGYWLRLCFGNPPGRSLPTSREDRHRIVCSIRLPLPPIPRIRELRADDDGARMRGSGRAPSLEPAQGGGLNARL